MKQLFEAFSKRENEDEAMQLQFVNSDFAQRNGKKLN